MDQSNVEPGIYRHFKGNLYEVMGVARKIDTSEFFVIYKPLYGEMQLVARPLEEFTGTVRLGHCDEPRFRRIEATSNTCRCQEYDHC